MATAPVAPQQGAQGAQGAPQQGTQLQTALAQLAKVCEQLAQQNPIVQPEMDQARQAFVQALRKTMMAAQPQQPSDNSPAPQGQGQ